MDLQALREEIDSVDNQLLELFLKRMDISLSIARYKKENALPIYHPQREKEILDHRAAQAGEGMAVYTRHFFTALMDISKELQEEKLKD